MSRIFNQDVSVLGTLTVNPANGGTDFLTLDSVTKVVKYRTPAEVLSDLGIIEDIEAYITDPTAQGLLEDTANWSQAGAYIGVPITGTFMGQKHFNVTYFFEATNDNQWIRLIREEHPDTVEAYIVDAPTIALLENTANWTQAGIYIGTPITGTFQGQKHYDSTYFFEATNDDQWVRLIREEHPDAIPAYITDAPTMALLENTANWDIDGVYIGTAITGTFQGQKHYDTAYFFEAVLDNNWIRYPRA